MVTCVIVRLSVGLASKNDLNMKAEQQYLERAYNTLKPEYSRERRYLKELELLFRIRSNDSSRITVVYSELVASYLVLMNCSIVSNNNFKYDD